MSHDLLFSSLVVERRSLPPASSKWRPSRLVAHDASATPDKAQEAWRLALQIRRGLQGKHQRPSATSQKSEASGSGARVDRRVVGRVARPVGRTDEVDEVPDINGLESMNRLCAFG